MKNKSKKKEVIQPHIPEPYQDLLSRSISYACSDIFHSEGDRMGTMISVLPKFLSKDPNNIKYAILFTNFNFIFKVFEFHENEGSYETCRLIIKAIDIMESECEPPIKFPRSIDDSSMVFYTHLSAGWEFATTIISYVKEKVRNRTQLDDHGDYQYFDCF